MGIRDLFDALRGAPPPAVAPGRPSRNGAVLDLELFAKDRCPYCQRVYRAIRRLKAPVRVRDITRDAGALKTLVEVGGEEQVPCLFVDGKPMYESADIIRFLEEQFGAPA